MHEATTAGVNERREHFSEPLEVYRLGRKRMFRGRCLCRLNLLRTSVEPTDAGEKKYLRCILLLTFVMKEGKQKDERGENFAAYQSFSITTDDSEDNNGIKEASLHYTAESCEEGEGTKEIYK